MKNAKHLRQNEGYFNALPETWQELVKDAIFKAADNRCGPEGWKGNEDSIESIECHSRDGFIASSHNKGGLVYQNFTDLMGYYGGGYTPKHEGAAKEVERQVEYSFKLVQESIFEEFKAELKAMGLNENDCNYCKINDLLEQSPKNELLNKVMRGIEDKERDYLSDSESSIMHEIRVMYHGKNDDGMHIASVSAAVNTEGPYHRTHIAWAPSVFCEGSKEIEIEWKNARELKSKLDKALKQVSDAIF